MARAVLSLRSPFDQEVERNVISPKKKPRPASIDAFTHLLVTLRTSDKRAIYEAARAAQVDVSTWVLEACLRMLG
jgi:hypothetical protein